MVAEVSGFADILFSFLSFLMSFITPKLKRAYLLKKLVTVSFIGKSEKLEIEARRMSGQNLKLVMKKLKARFRLKLNCLFTLFGDILPKFSVSERTRQVIKASRSGDRMIETALDPQMLLQSHQDIQQLLKQLLTER